MRKICWFLIMVLLLGCFAGCQEAPAAQRSIENEDGTLSDWMKEEIEGVFYKESGPHAYWGTWWNPNQPLDGDVFYYGTYNGYVMYHRPSPLDGVKEYTIAGYEFSFPTYVGISAYKDGEFYELDKLYEKKLVDKEDVRVVYERYCQVYEIIEQYRELQEKANRRESC